MGELGEHYMEGFSRELPENSKATAAALQHNLAQNAVAGLQEMNRHTRGRNRNSFNNRNQPLTRPIALATQTPPATETWASSLSAALQGPHPT